MHAAVSTFQMGVRRFASYSTKFRGVIGGSLGQDDLVIEADDNALWHSRRIVALVCDRVDQVLAEYRERCERIIAGSKSYNGKWPLRSMRFRRRGLPVGNRYSDLPGGRNANADYP